MQLTSSVFKNGSFIPVENTSEGAGVSPVLTWEGAPTGTCSFALVMTDSDIPSPTMRLGKFFHWIVYNIPVSLTLLPENFTSRDSEPMGVLIARNGAGKREYYPPLPVSGIHKYVFQLYALDVPQLHLMGDKPEWVLKEINRHTLETCALTGLYKCSKFSGWRALQWNLGSRHENPIDK
jgi:Raf kinase inhibitor-like YbhB/YbcL family protein